MNELFIGSVKKRMVGSRCPQCGRSADGGTAMNDHDELRDPKPGDVAVCLYCGALNTYKADLTLRKLDRAERRRIVHNRPELKKLLDLAVWAAQQKRREWQ